MTTAPLLDDEFVAQFLDTSLPSDRFPHAAHVRMAWLFVTRHGMPEALARFSAALQRFAAAKGAPGLYHATITWAYLLLVHERQARTAAASWTAFAEANPDLLIWKPSILDRFYTPETLWSDLARRIFVMPDRLAAADASALPASPADAPSTPPR
jgi:hypothetical protein